MLIVPALITLPLERTVSFDKVVFPAILAGAYKLVEGGRRGVSPGGGALAIISGALGGNESNAGLGEIRR